MAIVSLRFGKMLEEIVRFIDRLAFLAPTALPSVSA
jgi:hypothetical protein